MNADNIKYAIEVMKQAERLNMTSFQCGKTNVESVSELHTCGNTACFIGYLTLTPTWKEFLNMYWEINITLVILVLTTQAILN